MSTNFFKDLQTYFNTKNLYEILDLHAKCKDADIKKAYYKKSLLSHPDKAVDASRAEATEKFKLISKVYKILTNKEDREIYDQTGSINEDNSFECEDWMQYWRNLFPKITTKDIDEYLNKYRDSMEERSDLIRIYTYNCGNMDKILEEMLDGDEIRLRGIINDLIEDGEVENFDAYSKEPAAKKKKRQTKAAMESKKSEKVLEELKSRSGGAGGSTLENMILQNSENRRLQSENFLDQLAQKYSKPSKKK